MNMELLVKMLMKMLGVTPEQMARVYSEGHSMIVDGKAKIDSIDMRLERIERKMGIEGDAQPLTEASLPETEPLRIANER